MTRAAVAALWFLVGCGGGDDDAAGEADAAPPDATAAPPRIVYLNHDGGLYHPGLDDSSSDASSLLASETELPPWGAAPELWDDVVACVGDAYAPFNVEIVDVDPGDVDHVEIVVTTSPSVAGFESGVSSISPFDCEPFERGIALVFAATISAGPAQAAAECRLIAAATGNLYGLEWERECSDVMTYEAACGTPGFQDLDAPCGTFDAMECQCGGGTTQNTYRRLLATLGAR